MTLNDNQQILLRNLPGVDHLLERVKDDPFYEDIPRMVLTRSIRKIIENLRQSVFKIGTEITIEEFTEERILQTIRKRVGQVMQPNLRTLVNATGVVVHTNLGRSLLPDAAIENMARVAAGYSNLEFNLSTGKRGLRYSAVEELICEITGAQAAMVVNNNAGAVLLCLETIARGRQVIVSRGELVEIGGAFRVPDVMAKSGAILKEVGTTNRTHPRDYEQAIEENTGLLLKVHTSNYSVVGFTKAVSLKEMGEIGDKYDIPVMEDLGSGIFIDLSAYGLLKEPTVQESVEAGCDVVTFSGDKLLGGPQAGVIVGKKEILNQIKKNPMTRALRIDKLTLAALESVLRIYRDPKKALTAIPTLNMLTTPLSVLEIRAARLADALSRSNHPAVSVNLLDLASRVGGGALPLQELPSKCVGVSVKGWSADGIQRMLREQNPPVIGRIEDNQFIMDVRTINDKDIQIIADVFNCLLIK